MAYLRSVQSCWSRHLKSASVRVAKKTFPRDAEIGVGIVERRGRAVLDRLRQPAIPIPA